MAKIKTPILTGTEEGVTDLGGQNVAVKNLSDSTVWASAFPNVVEGADNVVEIPAGGGEVVLDARGTVYLLGTGKVQCTGTPYAYVNFKQPSSSGGTSGGGGGKSQDDVICGELEYVTGGTEIRSIPIEVERTFDIPATFAAALAEETGWELQSDGVTVMIDGEVGFRFNIAGSWYVWLVTNAKNNIDNFQYVNTSGSQYYMDICTSPHGAVVFGFRNSSENINLTFVLTKDGAGDNICAATFDALLEWVKENDEASRKIATKARTIAPSDNKLSMFKCPDIYSGGTLTDIYWIFNAPNDQNIVPGQQIIIGGKKFVIVYNERYTHSNQPWLAIPLN